MIDADSKRVMFYGIIASVVSALLMAVLTGFRLLAPLDSLTYDFFLKYHAKGHQAALNSNIILVTIDEESLAEINKRWPWNRSYFARIINFLHKAEAKVIGVDLLFIESSDRPEDDKLLSEALKQNDNIVIVSKIERIERNFINDKLSIAGERLVLPHPRFRNAATCGLADLEYDTGSVIRTFRPAYVCNEKKYHTFASAIYKKVHSHSPILPEHSPLYIDYLGGAGTFPTVPAYHILKGLVSPKEFKNKIVLIGPTFSDAHDIFATPMTTIDKRCPGVEIQANIITTMSNKSFFSLLPRFPQIIIVITLVALTGYLVMFHSAKLLLVTFTTVFFSIVSIALWMMYSGAFIMDISYPLLAIPLTFIIVSIPIRKPLVLDTKIGPYRLLNELGRGGMAVVYRAIHPHSQEEVALKQMLPEYASNPDSLKRFLREIELIRTIDHPNIIRIIDAGDIEGQPYYAMEYIRGSALDVVLKEQGRLNETEVRRIGGAIARALANAHGVGVIHRDIKPSNILLTNTGLPKLTDFGVARKLDAPDLTQTGTCIGTPCFIAPELCRGNIPSPASDIYSFGTTLYALLCGRPPFLHEDMHAIFSMVMNQEPINICNYCTGIDPELADLVMRCLRKDPKQRPTSMMELARALDPFYTEIALKSTVVKSVQKGKRAKIIKNIPVQSDEIDETTILPNSNPQAPEDTNHQTDETKDMKNLFKI